MKVYHIKVVGDTAYNYKIEAESVSVSSAGLYEFVSYSNGQAQVVAYFPISKTVIHRIEELEN